MSPLDRVTVDPAVCDGKPVIRGLPFPVESLLSLLASGMTADEVMADHPELGTADILAALEYAATKIRHGSAVNEPPSTRVRHRLTAEELIERHRDLPRVDAMAMRREADEFFAR